MSKEILISQPPPSNFGGGAAPSGGFASAPMAPPPISNYKGVMLCDRPVSKEHAGVHGLYGASDAQRPFLSMVQQKEQLGLCPSKESRLHEGPGNVAAQRANERKQFLVKHRKWLLEFNLSRKEMEAKAVEDEQRAAERKKKFEAYSKRIRDSIRGVKADEAMGADEKRATVNQMLGGGSGGGSGDSLKPAEVAARKDAYDGLPSSARSAKAKPAAKPAWAISEKQADALEEEELNELLAFAERLDYEKYIDDYEVKQTVQDLKSRIDKLRAEQNAELQPDAIEPDDSEWNKAFLQKWNSVAPGEPCVVNTGVHSAQVNKVDKLVFGKDPTDDARGRVAPLTEKNLNIHTPDAHAAAVMNADEKWETASHASLRSVMSRASVESIKQVHSTQSIRAILAKRKQRQAQLDAVAEDSAAIVGPVMRQPRVVSHGTQDQNTNSSKVQNADVSNLPYLHRNPAV